MNAEAPSPTPSGQAAGAHRYAALDVPVAGGVLRVGVWDPVEAIPGAPTVLAVHGITASHRAWPTVVAALPGFRIVAPDLRGRGRSNGLPGPYGMGVHAADMTAVLDSVETSRVVALGHSMGGFVAVVLAHRHPDRVSRLVLVDGGIPLPRPSGVPDDASLDEIRHTVLGPAIERLARTFPDRAAYHAFWRSHPAFAASWTDAIVDYVEYDLVGIEPELRAASRPDAVDGDSLELYQGGPLVDALTGPEPVRAPMTLLRAALGLLDEPTALYDPAYLATWSERLPNLRVRDLADSNHYTAIMASSGAAAVAEEIRKGGTVT